MFRNKAVNIALLVIIAITLFGIVGFVVYKTYFAAAVSGEVEEPKASELLAAQYEVGKMTTNLQGDALIQAAFTLQGESEDVKKELEERTTQIKYIINKVLHQTTQADIQKPDGLEMLEASLVDAINQVMKEGKVTNVYMSDIVVQ